MEAGQPSRTALSAAAHRAIHQTTDTPRVFDDPLAASLLGPDGLRHEALLGRRAMRAFICARSRLAEDALAEAVGRGVTQYLLLGAGLDTFAWRNRYPNLRVFEADHPDTQAWKRERLADEGLPAGLIFAPVDLEREPLAPALWAAGVDPDQRLFVAWLGVTPYLRSDTVMATLRTLASLAAGVDVVFDYGPPPQSLNGLVRAAYQLRAAKVASIGEPWLSGFAPDVLATAVTAMGYQVVENLGPDDLNARYYTGRTDGLRVLTGRVVRART